MKNFVKSVARNAMQNLVINGILKSRERSLVGEAQQYWEDPGSLHFQTNSHWRGDGGIAECTWTEMGERHIELLRQHQDRAARGAMVDRVIEWGCGGGANAIPFSRMAGEFVGVDISQQSLTECGARLNEIGYLGFKPVLIDVAQPEKRVRHLLGECDVFLCTYVFELLPTPDYGLRILRLAHDLLRPGGTALMQIKYQTMERRTRPRYWMYESNLANMTTYPIDVFWSMAEQVGFAPSWISLRPRDELTGDERYAYFLLDKRGGTDAQRDIEEARLTAA